MLRHAQRNRLCKTIVYLPEGVGLRFLPMKRGKPRWDSVVLLGPTGAGKTPLGDELERRGLWGRPCAHFDFGALLRRVARDAAFAAEAGLSELERDIVRRVVEAGALLERGEFSVAYRLLEHFVRRIPSDVPGWLVMNGLPRSVEQAEWLADRLIVRAVVRLDCTPEVALERIRHNYGGDRVDRDDDEIQSVRRRLALYEARTRPLVDFYAAHGARTIQLPVMPTSSAAGLAAMLEAYSLKTL